VLGQLPNRPSVVDEDVEEDKVSEDALKKLGLLQNYFPTCLSTFLFHLPYLQHSRTLMSEVEAVQKLVTDADNFVRNWINDAASMTLAVVSYVYLLECLFIVDSSVPE